MTSKTWYVGDVVWGTATMVYEGSDDPHTGKFVCDCDGLMFDNEVKLAGDNNPQHTAQCVADDHNRIPFLEAEIDTLREALAAVVASANRVTETVENGQPPDTKARWVCCGAYWDEAHRDGCRHLALQEALKQANALLATQQH